MENAGTTSITGTVRLVHVLKIEGFATTAKMNCGYIRSRWTVDEYDWVICVGTFQKVELFFRLLSKSREGSTSATLGCQLIDPRGKTEPSEEKTVTQIFSRYSDCSDTVQLMRRDELVTSGYLMDDTLALRCTITVLKELRVPNITSSKEVIALPSTNLHQQLSVLLQSEKGADVTFLVSGQSFPAHKVLLAARSPVFMAEFFGDMKETCSARVEIKDMEVAAFKAMLHFIYTDTVPELDQPLEEVTAMAQHLLAASDRYELDRLKLICEIKLSGGINVETAATTLALAEQHNCSKLKAKCMEFIVSSPAVLGAVLATEGYNHLEASCPLVLTELLKSVHVRKS